jgi:riboflavin transporter FmnP
MNSKSIALVITFAAVAIALNAIRIPTVFYPGTYFQFSQIPVVIAFLLFGVRTGVLVGLLNLAGGLALFPIGVAGLIVYPADFLSSLLMIAGIWIARKFTNYGNESRRFPVFKKPAIGLILGAIALRTGIMPFFDFAVVYHFLVPLIFGIRPSEGYILGLVPAFVLYNAIVSFYTVSAAYVVAAKVSKHLKIETSFLRN